MRYKRSHLIGLFAALLVLVTILGGGILLVIKEDHASAGSTEGAAYHFQGTDQPQATRSHKYHTNLNHKQTLILVNKDHALSKDYSVQLKTLKNGIQVAKVIYPHLRDMWFDCEAANPNYSINVVSGYRTRQKQTILLSEEIRKNERAGMSYRSAKKDALRSVAPADYSEHETGLCVDITASDHLQLDNGQAQTPKINGCANTVPITALFSVIQSIKKKLPAICTSLGIFAMLAKKPPKRSCVKKLR